MAETDEVIALQWALTLMGRAFRDLSASFAVIDADRADRAIHQIEATIAAELTAFCEKPPEGIVIDRAKLVPVVAPFREMTQSARALILQARKPKQ